MAKREVALPEGLEIPELTKDQVQKKMEEYKAKQVERFQKRLNSRLERFEEKLTSKDSEQRAIMIRKILIQKNKEEMKALRAANKQLRGEIKEMRPRRKRKVAS